MFQAKKRLLQQRYIKSRAEHQTCFECYAKTHPMFARQCKYTKKREVWEIYHCFQVYFCTHLSLYLKNIGCGPA